MASSSKVGMTIVSKYSHAVRAVGGVPCSRAHAVLTVRRAGRVHGMRAACGVRRAWRVPVRACALKRPSTVALDAEPRAVAASVRLCTTSMVIAKSTTTTTSMSTVTESTAVVNEPGKGQCFVVKAPAPAPAQAPAEAWLVVSAPWASSSETSAMAEE